MKLLQLFMVTLLFMSTNLVNAQEPVTVSNGSVKINSFNGVEIVNDFQVQQGATLEINP